MYWPALPASIRASKGIGVYILLTGLNHRSAPLDVRERFSLTKSQLPGALDALQERLGSGVVLSTCNRTEVYTVVKQGAQGHAALDGFLEAEFGVEIEEVRPYLYTLEQRDAVVHLYRVASSLDSLIVGESQILGQVRDAYSAAAAQGTARGVLTRLFHQALRVGKRARRETAIGRNALSVSRACVEMARRSLGDLQSRRGVVVGVGEASKLAAKALRDSGLGSLVVANRTWEHAQELAAELDGEVASLDQLPDLLREADVAVTSTEAPDFLISEPTVREAMALRGDRPLVMIDIAVPRDVDPAVGDLPGVHLYDIDDLEMVAEANRRERQAEVSSVEEIVQQEASRFQSWWISREVVPTIAAMRDRAEEIRQAELQQTFRRLPGLSAAELRRVETLSKALVKKLLHEPTKALLERGDRLYTEVVRELFGLDQGIALVESDHVQDTEDED
jgi:glutamyl-tRNA reductase